MKLIRRFEFIVILLAMAVLGYSQPTPKPDPQVPEVQTIPQVAASLSQLTYQLGKVDGEMETLAKRFAELKAAREALVKQIQSATGQLNNTLGLKIDDASTTKTAAPAAKTMPVKTAEGNK